ncbi:hypothetical protein QJS83_13665 [Bdellovibrio sp. 22V]|uniref:hypothetical protein n=1 Tax=Bdellovibrio sp. 22V TaxID=3044166 RepID=UPI002542E52F|nr:hypothetical protein [Bdellovibrio sp. 22V]WII71511.1 hypothetical protein QJS83_13665 [Bdellovibrio sp. 22V]
MKTLLLTYALLMTFSWAQAKAHKSASRIEGSACIECSSSTNRTQQQLRELRDTVTADASVEDIFKINERMDFADKCENFADGDNYGRWGKIIIDEMHRSRYEELYKGAADLTAVCPAYPTLNDNSKELVWVMVLNAMAHLESSCDKTERAQGPNGRLVGLLQLHDGREQVYAKNCRRGDGKTAEGTFRCGLSMLNQQLAKRDSLFSRNSYWDVLRPQAKSQKFKKVKAAISRLSVCK